MPPQDEALPFFDTPQASADTAYWSKQPYWTSQEAIALTLGKDPNHITLDELRRYPDSETYKQYLGLQQLLDRAIRAGELLERIRPAMYLVWANTKGLELPPDLTASVESLATDASWKALYLQLQRQQDELQAVVEDYEQLTEALRRMIAVQDAALERERQTNENDALLRTNDYWQKLRSMSLQLIAAYPAWRERHSKVQNKKRLKQWVQATLDCTDREAEVLSDILSGSYQEHAGL